MNGEHRRILRTLLFIPGNKENMLANAVGLGADAVILDLEDAVPAEEKGTARRLAAQYLPRLAKTGGPSVLVRVNSLSSGYLETDLQQIVQPGLDGICLPKVESASDIRQLDFLVEKAENVGRLGQGSLRILPLIESARGVIATHEIATASSRMLAVALGAEDLTLDLGVQRTAEGTELLYARSALVMGATAAGIPPIDAVYPDVSDEEGLIHEARLGRQLGFRGKLVIHPRQVDPVNAAFSPSQDEVEWAKRVLRAFQKAVDSGNGVVLLDGKMIDRPVVLKAKRILTASM